MNNIIYPFSNPIYHTIIEDSVYNKIKEDVLNYIDNNINLFKESWECPTLSNIGISIEKRFQNEIFNKYLQKFTNEYLKEWNFFFNIEPEFVIDETWINISPPGAYQEVHTHIESPSSNIGGYPLFSGVFYIEVSENSGDLVLKNPNNINLYNLPKSNKNPLLFNIPPKQQHLIMFPSYLEHSVNRNNSNQKRISISFNIFYNKL